MRVLLKSHDPHPFRLLYVLPARFKINNAERLAAFKGALHKGPVGNIADLAPRKKFASRIKFQHRPEIAVQEIQEPP